MRFLLAGLVLLLGACKATTSSPADSGTLPDASIAGLDATASPLDGSSDSDAGRGDASALDAAQPEDAGAADTGGPSCDPHAVAAEPVFTDATEAWGLGKAGLNVVGNRIIAADLDGDGYPDLIIHAIYTNARETIGTPPKLVWVLMNRPRPGGGRMFVDATVESGVFAIAGDPAHLRSAQLAVAGDVDNDGDLDLFSGTYVDSSKDDPGDRSTVLLNDGQGHFTAATSSGPAVPAQPLTGASFVDYDRDGRLDLFVGFWYQPGSEAGFQHELYRGQGDGTFASVTAAAGLTLDTSGSLASLKAGVNARPAYGVTTCDLDGDGYPELLVSAYGRQWNMAYLNNGQGHFKDVGRSSGFAGDKDLDYHDNQMFLCYCTTHPADADCQGVNEPMMDCSSSAWNVGRDDQPFRLNGNTFTTVCADIDGDGKPDLYNAEIHHWWAGQSSDSSELLVSRSAPGTLAFNRPGDAVTGMSWPHPTVDWNEGGLMAAAVDLDNDGRLDVVVAASDYPDQFGLVFHQKPGTTFEEVGAQWGIHHACVSGLAIADFDRDGDLDVVVGSGTARDCSKIWKTNEVHLYQSDASTKGSWLAVRLVGNGTTANRAAIGASVTLTAGGVSQLREVGGGYGHMAQQNDLVQFFGLGGCSAVDSISVRWPDAAGTTETWTGVAARRLIELRQGDPVAHEVKLP